MKQPNLELGGRPLNNDDLAVLQQELSDAATAQFLGKGPFIVSGCAVSGTSPNATVSAGIVMLGGQLLRFPGQSGITFPAQLQAGAVVLSDPRPYQTGGTKNCMREVPAVLVASDPSYSLGEFLPLNAWGGKRWEHVLKATMRSLYETQPLGTRNYVPANYDGTGLGKPGTEAWGWALANGANNTDDLRGRTIIGANEANSDYAVGATGGHESVTIGTHNLPPNPSGTKDVATFTGNANGKNLTPQGSNGWEGQQPPAGAGVGLDVRSPYIALLVRQWVGYY